jgi:prolyl-tRNA synthetase
MFQSKSFAKTRHEPPKDEVSKNARLLIQAGFIYKDMAGVYVFLPLGLRVLKKIEAIIRQEMDDIGGQEILLATLQDREPWEKSGRWDDEVLDVWFKTALKNKSEIGLAPTHEEPLTVLMRDHVSSYKDLPIYTYQFQTKFRNELRAKSGLIRSREFLMKDLYSFSRDKDEHESFYEKAKQAYVNIFKSVGLGDRTYITLASGGSFSKFSHEFQTVCDAGEDVIYVEEKTGLAVNQEVYTDGVLKELGWIKDDLKEQSAVEVGNIFSLGTKFSDALDLNFVDENGERKPVFMGSYGIGPARIMGTVVETYADDKSMVWPESISPFDIHLVLLDSEKENIRTKADELYAKLLKAGVDVLYDDRSLRPGSKFADADLIGIPKRVVVSEKTVKGGKLEIKDRISDEVDFMDEDALLNSIRVRNK